MPRPNRCVAIPSFSGDGKPWPRSDLASNRCRSGMTIRVNNWYGSSLLPSVCSWYLEELCHLVLIRRLEGKWSSTRILVTMEPSHKTVVRGKKSSVG